MAVEKRPLDSPIDMMLLEKQMVELDVSKEAVAKEQAILKSLSFESQPVRHTIIPEAHKQTFRWVFQTPTSDTTDTSDTTKLLSWLEKDNGVFWVSGKPGSGKSTLMKFIADEVATIKALSRWSGSKRLIIASHYFWSAGTEMQKSYQGLLQSLLCEIFRRFPALIEPTCRARWSETVEKIPQNWSLSELHEVLQEVVKTKDVRVKLCFFIDGLDEYDGDHFEVCEILKDLTQSQDIKICVSSRPWNVFEEAFGQSPQSKIYVHELIRGEIQGYAQSRLQTHPQWHRLDT
jgi:hypothetical protein